MAPMMDFLGNNVTQPVYDSGIFVISEMLLAISSIVFNLMVMSSLRKRGIFFPIFWVDLKGQ